MVSVILVVVLIPCTIICHAAMVNYLMAYRIRLVKICNNLRDITSQIHPTSLIKEIGCTTPKFPEGPPLLSQEVWMGDPSISIFLGGTQLKNMLSKPLYWWDHDHDFCLVASAGIFLGDTPCMYDLESDREGE